MLPEALSHKGVGFNDGSGQSERSGFKKPRAAASAAATDDDDDDDQEVDFCCLVVILTMATIRRRLSDITSYM